MAWFVILQELIVAWGVIDDHWMAPFGQKIILYLSFEHIVEIWTERFSSFGQLTAWQIEKYFFDWFEYRCIFNHKFMVLD